MISPSFMVTPAHHCRRPAPRRKGHRPVTTRVDPRVWAMALVLCDGNVRRLEVLSAEEVRVVN